MIDHSKYIKVYTGSLVLVTHLKTLLSEIGISALVKNDFQSGLMAGFSTGTPDVVEIYILDEDLDKAKPVIDDFLKSVND
ncbi:putative signal transducing protein [Aureivirga marina]|uniref:putative signal transducing protein n=1 Tax=Aureivirga marina TaxID=1182451 RepID=UPI0018CB1946|nr:DUF2007 domain-containing protein [Aureivirga marina]